MDLSRYWDERGKKYHSELENQSWFANLEELNQKKFLSSFLKGLSFDQILEVGCGNGRLTKLLIEHIKFKTITAIDASTDLISEAKKSITHTNVIFQTKDILQISNEKKYDLIFGGEILMHIPKENIKNLVHILVQSCDRKLIFVEFHNPNDLHADNDYVFGHDYISLFNSTEVKDVKIHLIQHSLLQKCVNLYANLRHRASYSQQAVIEVTTK